MSRTQEEDREEHMAKVAEWVKEGSRTNKLRKARNRGLIHLGIAVTKAIEGGNTDLERILTPHVVGAELANVRHLINEARDKALI